jgi:hypothetical protein
VRDDCLEFGMSQRYGIFGGKTSSQRDRLRASGHIRVVNVINEPRKR